MTLPPATNTTSRRAFTLIEMLVALGLIFLLASLVIVALGGVRSAANRADTISALRQMMQAYNGYTLENEQRFMPGNVDGAMVTRLGIAPRLATGATLNPGDSGAYVWRLAPYLGNEWETVFIDYRSEGLIARLALEYEGSSRDPCDSATAPVFGPETASSSPCNDLGISQSPSFGLNSIFVGGDNVHGGGDLTVRNPWDNLNDAIAATRFTEVKNAARLIVFAPSAFITPPPNFPADPPVDEVRYGSPELRAPFLEWTRDGNDVLVPVGGTEQWSLDGNNEIMTIGEFGQGGGVPIARWGTSEVPVGHLDGSVLTKDLLDLSSDLRSWSPFVSGY